MTSNNPPRPPEVLEMWVIYDHPTDMPDYFVVRRWTVFLADGKTEPERECCVANTIEQARQHVPQGKYNIGRYRQDDPKIAEVWL